MKVAIVGANGMLGQDLQLACLKQDVAAFPYDLPELDILGPSDALEVIPACDWVVNCAAYTDVDGAESHRDAAFSVNGRGPEALAGFCLRRGIPLLHLSTDYVFDGRSPDPIKEDDPTNPLSVYGASKLAGEEAVQRTGCEHLIVRSQSLFGVHGRNFVEAILARASGPGAQLRVVIDQVSSPTYTGHLAAAILRLMATDNRGIVHVSAAGACSWHAFACAIVEQVGLDVPVEAVSSDAFPRPARRPANAVLDKSRYEVWTGERLPHWKDGLAAYLAERAGRSTGMDKE